jgi:hypothetical protein
MPSSSTQKSLFLTKNMASGLKMNRVWHMNSHNQHETNTHMATPSSEKACLDTQAWLSIHVERASFVRPAAISARVERDGEDGNGLPPTAA